MRLEIHIPSNDQSVAPGVGFQVLRVTVQVNVPSGEKVKRACTWWNTWVQPISSAFKGDILVCASSWGGAKDEGLPGSGKAVSYDTGSHVAQTRMDSVGF